MKIPDFPGLAAALYDALIPNHTPSPDDLNAINYTFSTVYLRGLADGRRSAREPCRCGHVRALHDHLLRCVAGACPCERYEQP